MASADRAGRRRRDPGRPAPEAAASSSEPAPPPAAMAAALAPAAHAADLLQAWLGSRRSRDAARRPHRRARIVSADVEATSTACLTGFRSSPPATCELSGDRPGARHASVQTVQIDGKDPAARRCHAAGLGEDDRRPDRADHADCRPAGRPSTQGLAGVLEGLASVEGSVAQIADQTPDQSPRPERQVRGRGGRRQRRGLRGGRRRGARPSHDHQRDVGRASSSRSAPWRPARAAAMPCWATSRRYDMYEESRTAETRAAW